MRIARDFFCPGIASADVDALGGIEVSHFVGDCVLGHRGERAENADRASGDATFGPQYRGPTGCLGPTTWPAREDEA